MSYDFNDASEQRTGELIPANTIARIRMSIRPGSAGAGGWLTRSKSSDAEYLNAEFVVMDGQHAKRKFWQNFTVEGGARDEKGRSKAGEISRATLRAMLESARGILPTDTSPQAQNARRVPDWGAFDGLEFVGKIGVEPGKDSYPPKNNLAVVITPDKAAWKEHGGSGGAPVAPPAGQAVPASAAAATNSGAMPSWLR